MACDLPTQRKRRTWEKLDDECAPCRSARGWANRGTQAKYYWCEPSVQQVAPQWIFLNNGVLLQSNQLVGDAWQWAYTQLAPPSHVFMNSIGFNEVQVRESDGFLYSVFLLIEIGGSVVLPAPQSWVEQSGRIDLAPDPRAERFVPDFKTPGSPPTPGTFVGSLTFTPLKHCHNCVSGP